jgi:glycosyltransferase involved in cell wall biosynthesis
MPDGSVSGRFAGPVAPRVLLLLPSLQGGGAERVAVNLLNRCDPNQIKLRLGLLQRTGPYLADVDPSKVDVSPLAETWLRFEGNHKSYLRPHRLAIGGLLAPANAALMIRDFRPDLVVSFIKGMNLITYVARAALGRRRPRWIVREGNNTQAVIEDEISATFGRRISSGLVRQCYRAADCVLATSQGLARGLERGLGLDRSRLKVIPNPIDVTNIRRAAEAPMVRPPSAPFIVSAGRLEHQKGYDLLIRAFASSPACAGHELVILGQGEEQKALQALARELGVGERVRFPGFVANPWAYFARARLFVLPSRWEGFANVVAEALACGAPTLVTDCDYGPSEIVEHGLSGWVARRGSAEALRQSIDKILGDQALAEGLAGAGLQRAWSYNIDQVVADYTDLFIDQALDGREAQDRAGVLEPSLSPVA